MERIARLGVTVLLPLLAAGLIRTSLGAQEPAKDQPARPWPAVRRGANYLIFPAVIDKIRGDLAKLKLVRKKMIGFRFHRAPNAGGGGMKPSMDQPKAFARSLGFQNFALTVG